MGANELRSRRRVWRDVRAWPRALNFEPVHQSSGRRTARFRLMDQEPSERRSPKRGTIFLCAAEAERARRARGLRTMARECDDSIRYDTRPTRLFLPFPSLLPSRRSRKSAPTAAPPAGGPVTVLHPLGRHCSLLAENKLAARLANCYILLTLA